MKIHYGQCGEDVALWLLLRERRGVGFYVDVGCYHPRRNSNTFLLHRFLGFRGINIDATPGVIERFERQRPNDINLHLAVSPTEGEVQLYVHPSRAQNTIVGEVARRHGMNGSTTVKALPLASILDRHVPAGQTIDFLNVDVEGHDLDVLQSNDWTRYRPTVVAVEDFNGLQGRLLESPIFAFMNKQGYALVSHYTLTSIYRERSHLLAAGHPDTAGSSGPYPTAP